ncbi:MAG: type II toxin-antitoxin system Phd/YefM family antitoxin [Peptococcaceae bacterium]|nr:type II toxin-antitoxin system Phd/YefM family antitoxin [Peptococcaceae bacterium]
MDLRKVFDCMISVSELGRGQASKVIQAVEDFGNPFIVVKNNKPQAVIVSINEYTELMRAKDMLDSMRSPVQSSGYSSFSSGKANSLTEDEINIFLQNEEND